MTHEGSRRKRGDEVDIVSLRENIKEVLSYVSLVLSRSVVNPLVLTRMESEIGLSMEAIRSILLKIDEITKRVDKIDFKVEKHLAEEILHWTLYLKRFQVVLENLPSALGPYGDFEIFNLSLSAKKNISEILAFLEYLLKRDKE